MEPITMTLLAAGGIAALLAAKKKTKVAATTTPVPVPRPPVAVTATPATVPSPKVSALDWAKTIPKKRGETDAEYAIRLQGWTEWFAAMPKTPSESGDEYRMRVATAKQTAKHAGRSSPLGGLGLVLGPGREIRDLRDLAWYLFANPWIPIGIIVTGLIVWKTKRK